MNAIVIIATLIVLVITRIYLVIPKRNKISITSKNRRTKSCKTCVFLGSGNAYRQLYIQFYSIKALGGHTAEMLQLIKSLNPEHYYPRTYIVANTDILSKEKAIEYEQSTGHQVCFLKSHQ